MTIFATVIVWWYFRRQQKNHHINIQCKYFWVEVSDYVYDIEIRRLFVSHLYAPWFWIGHHQTTEAAVNAHEKAPTGNHRV